MKESTMIISISIQDKDLKRIDEFLDKFKCGMFIGSRSHFIVTAALERIEQIKRNDPNWDKL